MGNHPLSTPKVYFSSLDNQPKEEITRYPGWDYPKLDSFFVMGKWKMPMKKGKNWIFGVPTTNCYESQYTLVSYPGTHRWLNWGYQLSTKKYLIIFIKKKGTIWWNHDQRFWNKGQAQHKSINMFPSPKIEAYFVMLPLGNPLTTYMYRMWTTVKRIWD